MANPETLLGEIEAKTRELIGTVLEIVSLFVDKCMSGHIFTGQVYYKASFSLF